MQACRRWPARHYSDHSTLHSARWSGPSGPSTQARTRVRRFLRWRRSFKPWAGELRIRWVPSLDVPVSAPRTSAPPCLRQEASAVSTAHFNSSKYVYSVLTHLGLRPGKGQPALPLLEIGAINTSLLRCKWLATTAIDLRANAPGIQKQDFLTLPVPHTGGAFQAIVCSMVLNCVTDAADRGRMLLHAWQHLRRHGILLIGLPKRCLLASAFCDTGTWLAAVRAAGFQLVHCRQTPKLLFFALRRLDAPDPAGSASADQARPGVSAWLTGGPHALTEPPLLSPTCVFQRSDLVRDAPPAPPSAVQAAGEAAPGVDMQDWPLWLVQGVQEAAHLLAAPTEKLLGRVRSPQKCLHPRLLPAKGGDKAEFGVALEVQWAPTGAGEAAYAK